MRDPEGTGRGHPAVQVAAIPAVDSLGETAGHLGEAWSGAVHAECGGWLVLASLSSHDLARLLISLLTTSYAYTSPPHCTQRTSIGR
eukprot:scaffold12319_cov112-Isochrysis_galbana.AAC.2